jgi:hypothetical protein
VPGGRGRQAEPCHTVLPGRTGNVGGDYIHGVPVQAASGPVVPHGGPRVSVGSGLLNVAQRHPGVQRRGDKCVPKGVRPHVLADPGPPGDPADNPPGAVPVQPPPARGQEDRAIAALAGGQVDRPGGARGERDGDDLAALAGDRQGPVPALDAQVLDVSAGGLRDPQPVQREQRDQRMLGRRSESGGHQQRAELVAVQGGGMGLVIQPRPADMRGRGAVQVFFFDGVFVEPGDGGQPPGDGSAGASSGFQVPCEPFDVSAADGEQGQRSGAALGGELAQVECVGLAGQPAVPGQEPGEGEPFRVGEGRLDCGEGSGWASRESSGTSGRG